MRKLKNFNDENDITIRTIKEEKELAYSELTGSIHKQLEELEIWQSQRSEFDSTKRRRSSSTYSS